MNDMKVIELPPSAHYTPEQALASAAKQELSDVLIVGYVDGVLFVRSSFMTCAEAVFLLEKAKAWSLSGGKVEL